MLTYAIIFYNLFDTYFVYFFINSLTQLFCLNFSTPISASIFVFFFHPCVSATQQPIPLFVFATFRQQATIQLIFFSNQPSNSNFCFLLSSIFNSFFAFFPPCFFGIRCTVCQRPILEGSREEARLFRVLGIVYVTFVIHCIYAVSLFKCEI